MATAKVQCPGCRSVFTVKAATIESVANKIFRCPKCGTSMPFSRVLVGAVPMGAGSMPPAQALHTHIAGAPSNAPLDPGAKTRVTGGAGTRVTLHLDSIGRSFPLGPGTYTLGRDSLDSSATVKIAPDRYMSRMQASLTVGPGGVSISGLSPTNPIIVNGNRVDMGKPVALKNGDRLQLGMTKVTVAI